ncbi:CYTH domain-containing protein [Sansalvadorimonas verongulae]|uniref:CYTH domain-containing protein n=1 Tax=Sansalvadorimonas verongulae TaxID=2172824 RepID=UPI0012BC6CE1|nr:CYTH domain-containing protein [Sansalvadorimonas verongulae]MTI13607.1 CYTH domain-containing protein [Sansalvadorimonas verongulae]
MGREIELKLSLAAADHGALLNAPCLAGQPVVTLHLANTYFDTPDAVLNQHRVALRVREKNGIYIQTLKTRGESVNGLSHRGEWEWQLEGPELDGRRLESVWPEALKGVDVSTLTPVFRTDFERKVIDFQWLGASIELALDKGHVVAGSRTQPISELELELKEGDETALISLAEELGRVIVLKPENISKAERGYRLARGGSEG